MEICKVPALWLKALNRHNITQYNTDLIYTETENAVGNLTKANT